MMSIRPSILDILTLRGLSDFQKLLDDVGRGADETVRQVKDNGIILREVVRPSKIKGKPNGQVLQIRTKNTTDS